MVRGGVASMLLLVACDDEPHSLPSPEPPPGALFEPVCGSDGPHRVLPLAAGEHAYGVDRVADDGPLLVSTFFVDPERPLASLPPTLDLAITAVGPCGEAPVELARGLALTTGHRELVLACGDQGHGAHVLDLGGGAPRPILGPGARCARPTRAWWRWRARPTIASVPWPKSRWRTPCRP